MNKNKHLLLSIIEIAILVIAVVGVTYAFFTYSKTGSENVIRTGDIYFNSTETGNTVTLNNVFPVASSTIGTANESANDVGTVAITIEGKTTYNGGVEYVLTLDDVHTETNTNPVKEIPLSLNVSVESITDQTTSTTTSIGTANNNYFTARGTTASPSSTAIYKITAKETAEQDEQILVGYVPKDVTVKGKVVVKAYIDDAKVLITDTPDAVDTTGKTVLSTTEWNSIKGNSALSFKVKVEARDGIWVQKPIGTATFDTGSVVNAKLNLVNTDENKVYTNQSFINSPWDGSAMSSIGFVRVYDKPNTETFVNSNIISSPDSEEMIYVWAVDDDNTPAIYYEWYSDANVVYLNVDSSYMFHRFAGFSYATGIDSINTTKTRNMSSMFKNDGSCDIYSLISNWDVSNVTDMSNMFYGTPFRGDDASSLSKWNVSGVTNFSNMFATETSSLSSPSEFIYPIFTSRPGTWNNDEVQFSGAYYYSGTYIPNE